ncbi:unnamed protein product [Amoebophrya sp. A25]|nr:unnamed protein product [Amoebophrya sp. A25]|eukprot:GSA25T00025256001.1
MKKRKMNPEVAKARAAKAEQKKQEKAAAAQAKKDGKIVNEQAKQKEQNLKAIIKRISDTIKSGMKGKKEMVNCYRTYSVPGKTLHFNISTSTFEVVFSGHTLKKKRDGSEATLSLGPGQVQDLFGKTKCKSGSMYAQFEICSANITYDYLHNELKMTCKTTETF